MGFVQSSACRLWEIKYYKLSHSGCTGLWAKLSHLLDYLAKQGLQFWCFAYLLCRKPSLNIGSAFPGQMKSQRQNRKQILLNEQKSKSLPFLVNKSSNLQNPCIPWQIFLCQKINPWAGMNIGIQKVTTVEMCLGKQLHEFQTRRVGRKRLHTVTWKSLNCLLAERYIISSGLPAVFGTCIPFIQNEKSSRKMTELLRLNKEKNCQQNAVFS